MAITALPTPPNRNMSPEEFIAAADAFLEALPQFQEEANAAAEAMNLNATSGTSATSNSIGTGAKTFTANTGKSWLPGMFLVIADTAAPSTNSMIAQVTSYNSGTGALVVDVKAVLGSGTKTAWTISQTTNPIPLNNTVATAAIQDDAVSSAKIAADAILAEHLSDSALGFALINGTFTASVAGNALTVAIKTKAGTGPSATDPVLVVFRSATAADGTYSVVSITAATSLTVSSGSTLGTVNAQAARLVVMLINNAGTAELAIANQAGGTNLDETGVISTTAEGGAGAADSATVVYSTTARNNVAYRAVGLIDITEATAGTWATSPSRLTLVGGNQALSMGSLGFGQTYQDVTASRALSSTYYNTTGKPITVVVRTTNTTATSTLSATIGGVSINLASGSAGTGAKNATFVVPPGMSYSVTENNVPTLVSWYELR
jgi:hypothetical protein